MNRDLKVKAALSAFGFVALLVICTIFAGIEKVNPGTVGVVVSFGKTNGVIPEGLNVVVPYRDEVIVVDVSVHAVTLRADSTSKDMQQVLSDVTLNYYVNPLKADTVYKRFRNNHEQIFVKPALEEAIKASMARYTAEGLIANRPKVKDELQTALSKSLKTEHIELVKISLKNFDFSAAFDDAIDKKQIEEQKALQANNILRRIKIEAEQAEAKARGEANAQLAKAEAEAKAQILLDKSLTERILRLRAIEKWDGTMPQVLGKDSGSTAFFEVMGHKKRLEKRR